MTWVAGVDGCRAGWVVVLLKDRRARPHSPEVRLFQRWQEILAQTPSPAVLAVDIPIGLLDRPRPGGRRCDQEARQLLGRRASCVFSPPARSLFRATSYAQVRSRGLSAQAFGILPKVREVDRLMTPGLQKVVREAHPELAFLHLAGHPMRYNKKTASGRRERLRALKKRFPDVAGPFRQSLKRFRRQDVAPDDLLDAFALAWTALRVARGTAGRVPPYPPRDGRGLRMEIWY